MRRRIVLLSAALLLALAGTMAITAYVEQADSRALAGTEAVEVLVAAGAIPEGTPVELARAQGLVTSARFPRTALPPDALTTLDHAAGTAATRAVAPREILLASTFGTDEPSGPNTAGLTLPPGTTAVPVSLKSFAHSEDWASYLRPGAEIAIYQTFTSRTGAQGPYTPRGDDLADDAAATQVTRLLLDRAPVIDVRGAGAAADADADPDEQGAEADGSALVLALTQQQSERLIMGLARESALYPVLLSADSRVAPSPGTVDQRLFDVAPTAPSSTPRTTDPASPASSRRATP